MIQWYQQICSCWGWENFLHLRLGAVCDSREPGAASKRLWGIKGQAVEGGSRAGMPEMPLPANPLMAKHSNMIKSITYK